MPEARPKLTRGVLRSLSQMQDPEQQVSVIVRYTSTRRIMRHRGPLRGVRWGYDYSLLPLTHMHATRQAIELLEGDAEVVRIYEDRRVQALLDASVPKISVPRLWEEGLTGRGVRLAIVDTGIDAAHPDLQGRIADQADFAGEGDRDGNGHGTHCAGIAAGSGQASGMRYRGVAPEALLYAAKVLDAEGGGMMSDVMAGIEWAVEQGVQVINLSLGSPGPCDGDDALCEICDAAVAQGVVVCTAAGNEGPERYTIGSPGCAREVITIGACTLQDQVASFSSRGPTADGRQKPDLVFPGVDIVGARAQGTAMGSVVSEYYTAASGTSMATPHAAGVCALLLQALPELTPQEIKARLMSTARDLGQKAYDQGRGLADAWRARHTEAQPEPTPPPGPGPSTGVGCLTQLARGLLLWGKR